MKQELELIVKLVNCWWNDNNLHYGEDNNAALFHSGLKNIFKDTSIEFKYIAGTDSWELKTEQDKDV